MGVKSAIWLATSGGEGRNGRDYLIRSNFVRSTIYIKGGKVQLEILEV